MAKIPGVFRVQDNLGVPRTRADLPPIRHATTQELMRPGADPWSLGNAPRDADAAMKPTKENVQQFYTNALRSSGSKAEAIARTKKMFDLVGLDVDNDGNIRGFRVADDIAPSRLTAAEINQRNRRYWEPDKQGDAAPPTAAPLNQGNATYVLTLPPGQYDAEDGDDAMKILRVADGSTPEIVASVPKGTYRLEADPKTGHQHLYRLPDGGVPERVPLSDMPTKVGDHAVMPNAIRRMNERLQRFYANWGDRHDH